MINYIAMVYYIYMIEIEVYSYSTIIAKIALADNGYTVVL